jgi:transaldolase
MAQKTYSSHRQLLSDKRWQALAEAGARPQRVLWASTSTKDPDLPDTYYLGRLPARHDRHDSGKDVARLRRPWPS